MDYQDYLKKIKPEKDFFIGIDSDGCVFDSMEVKQKEFFIPNALKYFNLYSISKILRETWEFINLYSVHRGGNRFTSMIKVFELLSTRKEIRYSAIELPDLSKLREWTNNETRLGNATLRKYYEQNHDPSLEVIVKWTEAVNEDIERWLRNIPPFQGAKTAIMEMSLFADSIVVSQTPLDALEREWEEHNLRSYIRTIAAQEHGTKTEHIALSAIGKYQSDRILMIGDAIGDLIAAQNNRILFFPIVPGKETESWQRLLEEGLGRFKNGTFSPEYQESLLNEFTGSLPSVPPWCR